MKRTILILAAAAALVAFTVPTVASAITGSPSATSAATKKKKKKAKPKTKTVTMNNYYYGPNKVSLKVGDSISWKWPDAGGDQHDVALKKGPKGLKPWHSPVYTAYVTWKKKFTVAGNYSLVCTLHPDTMVMTVKVAK